MRQTRSSFTWQTNQLLFIFCQVLIPSPLSATLVSSMYHIQNVHENNFEEAVTPDGKAGYEQTYLSDLLY